MLDEVTAWAASRPSVELRGLLSKPEVFELHRRVPRPSSCRRSGRRLRAGRGRGDGGRRTAAGVRPRFLPRARHRRRRRRVVRSRPARRPGQAPARRRHRPRPVRRPRPPARGRRTRPSTSPGTPSSNCSTSTGSPSTSQPHRLISPQHVPPEGRAMEQRDPSPPVTGRGTAWYRHRPDGDRRRSGRARGRRRRRCLCREPAVLDGGRVVRPRRDVHRGRTSWRRQPRRPGSAATSRRCPARPPHPAGAVVVSATQNLHDLTEAQPGRHDVLAGAPASTARLGRAFSQVIPKQGNVYIGAPGAVLDGAHGRTATPSPATPPTS